MNTAMDEEQVWIENHIAWLKEASPEDWHRVVLDFNWDSPMESLFWIVQQQECDRATALTVFWLAQPICYLFDSEESDWERQNVTERKLVHYIGDRIHAKGYVRGKIAFDATPLMLQDYDELVEEGKKAPGARLKAHPDMKRFIRGREVSLDRDFYQRYPEEFHGSVSLDLPESDIVTPHMKTARFEVTAAILNFVVVGFMSVYLAAFGIPKPNQLIRWFAAVAALSICMYTSRSSLQTFRGLVRVEHVPMPVVWIRAYVIASLLCGAAFGLAYQYLFMSPVQMLIQKFGTFATILAGIALILPLLWLAASGFARVLVYRKTFR